MGGFRDGARYPRYLLLACTGNDPVHQDLAAAGSPRASNAILEIRHRRPTTPARSVTVDLFLTRGVRGHIMGRYQGQLRVMGFVWRSTESRAQPGPGVRVGRKWPYIP